MNRLPPLKITDPGLFGRVGLVIGGESAEREVSLNGGKAVSAALTRQGIDCHVFDGPMAGLEGIFKERKGESRALLLAKLLGTVSTIEVDALMLKKAG